jgi:acyl-CoA synthetase (NDP forming)
LKCYGFEILPSTLAKTKEEAAEFVQSINSPVALKIVSPQILHKSDVGGVVLNINDGKTAMQEFEVIVQRGLEHFPMQRLTESSSRK